MTARYENVTYDEQRHTEVDWYRKHGRYRDRIGKNVKGHAYVVPDLLWNSRKENHNRQEHIDLRLSQHVANVHYGWKA